MTSGEMVQQLLEAGAQVNARDSGAGHRCMPRPPVATCALVGLLIAGPGPLGVGDRAGTSTRSGQTGPSPQRPSMWRQPRFLPWVSISTCPGMPCLHPSAHSWGLAEATVLLCRELAPRRAPRGPPPVGAPEGRL